MCRSQLQLPFNFYRCVLIRIAQICLKQIYEPRKSPFARSRVREYVCVGVRCAVHGAEFLCQNEHHENADNRKSFKRYRCQSTHTHAAIHSTFASLHTNRSAICHYLVFHSLADLPCVYWLRSISTRSAIEVHGRNAMGEISIGFFILFVLIIVYIMYGDADSELEGWLSVDTREQKQKNTHRLNQIDNSHTTDGCSPFSLSTMASSMR